MVAKRADKPVVANSAPEVLQDEEKAFPRGGGSTISALDRRRIKAEAQADAERDFFAEASAAKRRKLGTSQVCSIKRVLHPADTEGMFCWNGQHFVKGQLWLIGCRIMISHLCQEALPASHPNMWTC